STLSIISRGIFMKKIELFVFLALAAPIFGQTDRNLLAKHWGTSRDLTIEVADAMPAEFYGFRPNQEEMSFGQLVMHIATVNNSNSALVAGEPAPAVPEKLATWHDNPAVDKGAAMKFLSESFDYCLKTLASLSTDKLNAMTGPAGRQLN